MIVMAAEIRMRAIENLSLINSVFNQIIFDKKSLKLQREARKNPQISFVKIHKSNKKAVSKIRLNTESFITETYNDRKDHSKLICHIFQALILFKFQIIFSVQDQKTSTLVN